MAPRANWKGIVKIAELVCPVALFTAASTAERIAFHTLSRETGHRVRRQFVDAETGEAIASEDQVKGFETDQGETIILEPEDIASAVPQSDKTLEVKAFVSLGGIDDIYFDRPYYLAPSTPVAAKAFAVLRGGLATRKVAALAQTVLFRRLRSVLVYPQGEGLIATTLNFDYEVRVSEEAFRAIPDLDLQGEMLDLARHIIATKMGRFDPGAFQDRYEEALAELVKAKIEGRPIAPPQRPSPPVVTDLLHALRQSAGKGEAAHKKKPAPKRKTG